MFGRAKQEAHPRRSRACERFAVCNGEAPKIRFVEAHGETGPNYLCDGHRAFFSHADGAMRRMAGLIRRGGPAAEVMAVPGKEEARSGRKDPCSLREWAQIQAVPRSAGWRGNV